MLKFAQGSPPANIELHWTCLPMGAAHHTFGLPVLVDIRKAASSVGFTQDALTSLVPFKSPFELN